MDIEDIVVKLQRLEDELRQRAMDPLITVGNGRQRTLGEMALDLSYIRRELVARAQGVWCSCGRC